MKPIKEKNTMSNTEIMPIPDETIICKIFYIRELRVMLDKDLASLYGVGTRDLNKAVKRNTKRFPDDFMFQLTKDEVDGLMFHFGTSNRGGTRKLPNAFTEQGIAMLSGILHSDLAIQINIQIIRVFTRMRKLIETNQAILQRLLALEKNDEEKERRIMLILDYLKSLDQMKQREQLQKDRKKIGFRINRDEE
jgi:hypothetical protein